MSCVYNRQNISAALNENHYATNEIINYLLLNHMKTVYITEQADTFTRIEGSYGAHLNLNSGESNIQNQPFVLRKLYSFSDTVKNANRIDWINEIKCLIFDNVNPNTEHFEKILKCLNDVRYVYLSSDIEKARQACEKIAVLTKTETHFIYEPYKVPQVPHAMNIRNILCRVFFLFLNGLI